MRLDILSPNPFHSVIPGFDSYLIKDNTLNDLCGKTLGLLSEKSSCHKENVISMGKYVFQRHFDAGDQKKATLAALIDCHHPARTDTREPNIHSGSFNND